MLEAIILATLTVTIMYLAAYIKYKTSDNADEDLDICKQVKDDLPYRQFLCKDESLDRLATLLFET